MTLEQTGAVLQILYAAYPHIYKTNSAEQTQQTIDLYHSMFGEYPTDIVLIALKNYIRTNKDFPSIAGIQEQIDILMGVKSPAELWALLEKAIRRSAYNYVEEFHKLPPEVQRWLGEPVVLHNLGLQPGYTLQTVTRGQFMKTISVIQVRDRVMKSLPDNLKDDIKKLGDKMGA